MFLRTIKSAKIENGTRVLLRADFDVVLKNGKILEDFRIKEVLPTLKFILARGGRARIISHLGRPGGRRIAALSMRHVASYLEKLLKRKVIFVPHPFVKGVFDKFNGSPEILLFENIRFFEGEENNSPVLARKLVRFGDIYVNEAFAVSHRKHASVLALTNFLPSFAGLRLEEEISKLTKVLENPHRPSVAIIGGAKLETKLPLIERFLSKGAEVLLGGALVNTFFSSRGILMGSSPVDESLKRKLDQFSSPHLYLPVDFRVARSQKVQGRVAEVGKIKSGETNFDVGPATSDLFVSRIKRARTVVWNGPLGLAENQKFSYGTKAVARALRMARAFKIVGGGDTIAILKKYQLLKGFDHVSTGGGGMLGFLAGENLPAVGAFKK